MHTKPVVIRRALISVSNKQDITHFAKGLHGHGVEILSTGGTAKAIRDAGIPVMDVSEFTGFPEMMDGRVKTLHPRIHAGILGLRDEHKGTAEEYNIKWIDLVVCNLYPFSQTIRKPGVTDDEAIENIDIGGPTMIRSAAKNVGWVTTAVDPADYTELLDEIAKTNAISFETRKRLAVKAFGHTGEYDSVIFNYFSKEKEVNTDTLTLTYTKHADLRYGENPHQNAAVYKKGASLLLDATIHQGKQLSYNNINDADGALACLREFTAPACVVVKHANPCGVAQGEDITDVFKRAYAADSLSAFGGIIAINQPCNEEIAKEIVKVYAEIVLAPSYEDDALEILKKKKNMRVLELDQILPRAAAQEIRYIDGGLLTQDVDTQIITKDDLTIVTKKWPTPEEINDMLFSWKVLKHVKSNGILIAKNMTTLGIGPGQVSRVDAVKIARRKSGNNLKGSILASDAFFPFRDSIDELAGTGIRAIIQPGGSIKDKEVIQACNDHGIAMVFTGSRCFKH